MYLDSAYIAKFYVNESDSRAVRELIGGADSLVSSHGRWAKLVAYSTGLCGRTSSLSASSGSCWMRFFVMRAKTSDILAGDVTNASKGRSACASAPAGVYLRAGDAVHLAAAMGAEEHEIWTNDRHLLRAAEHFGLSGRSFSKSTPIGSPAYKGRAVAIRCCAKSAKMRQS